MASVMDFPAKGTIQAPAAGAQENLVVFRPAGTRYELHLETGESPNAPAGAVVRGIIRVKARKIWTVISGGSFITPIMGPPRTIQGRVCHVEDRAIVVQAGAPVVVELPENDNAIDLNNGPIAVGVMVNVAALPGASFQLAREAAKTA